MQYVPYLVCGVTPYSKIVNNFRIKDGGTVLDKVSVDTFRYILSPTESIPPEPITQDAQNEIDAFVNLVKGGFMPDLIDKYLLLDKCPQIQDNTTQTVW